MSAAAPHAELTEFRKRIDFLRDVPDRIFLRLDPGEFLLPDERLSDERKALETALDAHVMTYRRDVLRKDVPVDRHLCAHLALKQLTPDQKALLQEFEERCAVHDVNFCAYEKPLRILEGECNPTYRLMRKVLS